jgi:A/G-specific adenine glycosylase
LNSSHFSRLLILWYEQNKRDLPWRNTTNPYFIWLSEIILQQTRVSQGLPYYEKFIKQYPAIENLAKAGEEEVLRLWQGLGYYSRARNMHSTAKSIHSDLKGNFPNNYKDILKLKGIGKYTAGAIASFAFKEKVPVVDGNVYRVLSRVFGIDQDISSPKGQKEFLAFAEKLLPEEQIHIYNQAIMEFGAMVCLPKTPICADCIFRSSCFALKNDLVSVLPVKTKKLGKRERQFSYFVIKHNDKLLMHRREGKDIWKGLYQFYLRETHADSISDFLPDPVLNKVFDHYEIKVNEPNYTDTHVLSHQVLRAKYWEIEIENGQILEEPDFKDLRFYNRYEVEELPKPILINNYLSREYF